MKEIVFPIQPTFVDDNGTIRFRLNSIVRALLETSTLDLNKIACMDFTKQERMQLAQLIGYSLGGFGELSYVDDETYGAAARLHENEISEQEARMIELREQFSRIKESLYKIMSEIEELHPEHM